MKTMLPLFVSLCLFSMQARAEAVHNDTPEAVDPLSATVVLNRLHAINQNEIHAGEMATSRATSQQTRDFGQRMIDDHTQADQKVVDLAQNLNVTLVDPMKLGLPAADERDMKQDRQRMHALAKLSGRAFDRHYLGMMATGHAKAFELLQEASASAEDQEVRDLAKALLPTVRAHQDLANTELEAFGAHP